MLNLFSYMAIILTLAVALLTAWRLRRPLLSQNLMSKIITTIPGYVYVYDIKKLKCSFCDQRVTAVLGYSPNEWRQLFAQDMQKQVHNEDLQAFLSHREKLVQAVDDETRFQVSIRLRNRRGDWVWLQCTESVVKRGNNLEPQMIVCHAQDVTQQISQEERTLDSERQYRRLVDTSSEIILSISPLGIIDFASFRFEQELGYHIESAIGHPLISYLHVDDLKLFERIFRSAKLYGQTIRGEHMRMQHEDGAVLTFSFSISPVRDDEGTLLGFTAVAQNISSQLETEALLAEEHGRSVQSAKLAALGEMAGGVAHEINNPLAIICGYATQLRIKAEAEEMDKEQLTLWATKIESTAWRIKKIVSSLRTIARDGQRDPFQDVLVHSIVEDALSLCGERFRAHAIELSVQIDPPDLRVSARHVQLAQVMVNLLNNAYHAVEKLPQGWIRITASESGQNVLIQVTDAGCGIPIETRDKIFQPFFTTKEVGQGTGLGLSISASIMREHHGELGVDHSNPHTCFFLRLPRAQAVLPRTGT